MKTMFLMCSAADVRRCEPQPLAAGLWLLVTLLSTLLSTACTGRPADRQKLADAISSGNIAAFNAELERGFSADSEFLRILLDLKIRPDFRTKNGSTPLMFAAADGSLEGVRMLLDRGAKVDNGLEPKSRGPMTPLQAAAGKGHLQVVKFLVERGADIDRCHPIRSPLLFAKEAGHQEIVDYLISKGARSDTGMSGRALEMLDRCR